MAYAPIKEAANKSLKVGRLVEVEGALIFFLKSDKSKRSDCISHELASLGNKQLADVDIHPTLAAECHRVILA